MTTLMSHVADVLEKTADYIDRLEQEKRAASEEKRRKTAAMLAERLTEMVGEPVDESLITKLSNLDPEVNNLLISKLAGEGRVDSMGEPSDNEPEKVASLGGLPPEDARLLSWVNS